MTFIDVVKDDPRPVPSDRVRVVAGRLERYGFGSGDERGADWMFTIEGEPSVFSVNPRSDVFDGSRTYVEETLALSAKGDEIRIAISPTGRVVGFDNVSTGRTMETMRAARSTEPNRPSAGAVLVGGIAAALVAVLAGSSIWFGGAAFEMSDTRNSVYQLVNAGQAIAAASLTYYVDNGTRPGRIEDLLPREAGETYLRGIPDGPAGYPGARWRIAEGAEGLFATIPIDPATTSDVCAEVVRLDGRSGGFACTDDEGRSVAPEQAKAFSHRIGRDERRAAGS